MEEEKTIVIACGEMEISEAMDAIPVANIQCMICEELHETKVECMTGGWFYDAICFDCHVTKADDPEFAVYFPKISVLG